jgi:nucleoside 2-deoxyribosyltransferase
MVTKVYFAAPLFNPAEREFNRMMTSQLEEMHYEVYLPQRDGGLVSKDATKDAVYEKDIQALKDCDVLLAVMSGEAIDPGVAFEIGYATALGKHVLLHLVDSRWPWHRLNAMFYGARIINRIEEFAIELVCPGDQREPGQCST